MSIRLKLFVSILSLLCFPVLAQAQTKPLVSNLMNPAISVNALFLAEAALDHNQPYGLGLQAAEILATSTVDQNWNLNAVFVFADEEVVVEEVFATTVSVPNVQLKLGKMKAAFGKQGLLHTHAFPFVQAPLAMVNTLGTEGFITSGVEAAWLTPLPWFCELTLGGYLGGEAEGHEEEEEGHAHGSPLDFGWMDRGNVPFLGHLKNVFDLSDDSTLEFGLSTLVGRGDDNLYHAAYGGDLTVRNVPAREATRAGWILQGEYFAKFSYDSGVPLAEQDGWYASFQYRIAQQWWTGIRVEEAFHSHATGLVDAMDEELEGHLQRLSVNLAWAPTEFSAVRLEYSLERFLEVGLDPIPDNRLMLQFNYTIGAHPAHAY